MSTIRLQSLPRRLDRRRLREDFSAALLMGGATSDRIDCGNPALLTNVNTGTICAWVKCANTATNQRIWSKGIVANIHQFRLSTSRFDVLLVRAGTSLNAQADATAFAAYAINKWIFVVGLWDSGGTAGSQRLLMGDEVRPPAEPSSYVTQTAGSGSVATDAGANFCIGNAAAATTVSWNGPYAAFGMWSRLLPDKEIAEQWDLSRRNGGMMAVTPNCINMVFPGYGGLGRQLDWSGNGNHGTLTGARIARGLEVLPPRRRSVRRPSQTYTITPAGLLVPTGALLKSALPTYNGSVGSSGAIARTTAKTATGAIVPAGSTAHLTDKGLSGAIVPVGVVTRAASAVYAGVLAPAGALIKSITLTVVGGVTPSGTLSTLRAVLRTFTGDLTPTGAIVRDISKSAEGSVAPTGAIAQAVSTSMAGAIALAGGLARTIAKVPAGALSPFGGLTRHSEKGLDGSVAPIGDVAKAVSATLRGALAPAGGLNKLIQKFWSGVLGWLGQLTTSTGAAPVSSRLEVVGSYVPAVAVTALYQHQLAVTGAYAPAMAVTGEFDA